MKCPHCPGTTEVLSTVTIVSSNTVTRRRECLNGHKFSTIEQIAERGPSGVLRTKATADAAALVLQLAKLLKDGS